MKLYFPNLQPEPFVYGCYNPICDEAPDSYCLVLELPAHITMNEVFYYGNNDDAYYANGLRSISVGDVVLTDEGKWMCCVGIGWQEIAIPQTRWSKEENEVKREFNIQLQEKEDGEWNYDKFEKEVYSITNLKRRLRTALLQSAHYKKLYEQAEAKLIEDPALKLFDDYDEMNQYDKEVYGEEWHNLHNDDEVYEGDWRDEQY